MVIAFHASFYLTTPKAPWNWLNAGFARMWSGVAFFFVISGYCISATADAERTRKRGPVMYFKRRFRRIFPPYWASVALFAVLVVTMERIVPGLFCDSTHPINHPASLGLHWFTNLTLTESWAGNLGDGAKYFLGHAWSLCYEEQFYAVTGLLLLLFRRHFFAGSVVITILTIAAKKSPLYLTGAFWDGYWLMFASGIAVYWSVNYASRRWQLVVIGCLVLGIGYFSRHPSALLTREAQGCQFMVAAFSFAIVLLAIHRYDKAIVNGRFSRPVLFCGTMCYSLYLVHWPVTKAVSHGAQMLGIASPAAIVCGVIPACYVASLLLAYPFHLMVERRFMSRPPSR